MMEYCKCRGDEMYGEHVLNTAYAIRNKQLKQRIAELEAALASLIEVADKNSEYLVGETQDVVIAEVRRARETLEGGAS